MEISEIVWCMTVLIYFRQFDTVHDLSAPVLLKQAIKHVPDNEGTRCVFGVLFPRCH